MFIIGIKLNAAIPVTDFTAITEEAVLFASKIKKWAYYIKLFTELDRLFVARYDQLKLSFSGYLEAQISRIKYIIDLKIFKNGAYWYDLPGRDIWSNIFKGRKKITENYPSLNDYELIYKSIIYRKNKYFRKYADKMIKNDKEYTQNLESIMNTISGYRLFDKYREERFQFFEKYLRKWSLRGEGAVPTSDLSRLYWIMSAIKYEKILVKMEINYLIRSIVENNIKKELYYRENLYEDSKRYPDTEKLKKVR
jgi:hypothetical protein